MIQNNSDGFPIVIDWYDTDEKVQEIEDGFKAILSKYNLNSHYDNLMFMMLTKLQVMEYQAYELDLQYEHKTRARELAQVLLAFKDQNPNHVSSILIKTVTEPVKIADPQVCQWIGKLIKDAINEGGVPLTLLGMEDSKMLTEEQLKQLATSKIKKPSTGGMKYVADFCLHLYLYMIKETSIRPDPNTLLSDTLSNFYFDVLTLFKLIEPTTIESEPKDYISTLLRNRIKKLND